MKDAVALQGDHATSEKCINSSMLHFRVNVLISMVAHNLCMLPQPPLVTDNPPETGLRIDFRLQLVNGFS